MGGGFFLAQMKCSDDVQGLLQPRGGGGIVRVDPCDLIDAPRGADVELIFQMAANGTNNGTGSSSVDSVNNNGK